MDEFRDRAREIVAAIEVVAQQLRDLLDAPLQAFAAIVEPILLARRELAARVVAVAAVWPRDVRSRWLRWAIVSGAVGGGT